MDGLEKLNAEQKESVFAPIKNLLISAGAGSGKTFVLTLRIVRQLIEDKIPISKFLILTFTEAAAKEMKNRIKKALFERKAYDIIASVDMANIQTYDSFRLSLLKQYGYKENIRADVSIASQDIIGVKVHQIIQKIIEDEVRIYKNPELKLFIEKYCSTSLKPLEDFIFNGYIQYSKNFDKEKFYSEYSNKFLTKNFFEGILNDLLAKFIFYQKEMKKYFENLSFEAKEKELTYFGKIFNAKTVKDFVNGLSPVRISPSFKDENDKFNHEKIKYYYEKIKEYKGLDVDFILDLYPEYETLMPYLLSLIKKTYDLTYEYKVKNGIFEFSDIEIITNNLVTKYEDIREDLKKKFDIIMIDEFQDTSDNQDAFISSFEKDNLFLVGDVKQAIYRFRGANPDIFLKFYKRFDECKKDEVINMNTNYRSREEVTDYVNKLFSRLMNEERGGIEYSKNHLITSGNNMLNTNKFSNNQYGFSYLKLNEKSEENEAISSALMVIDDIKEKIMNKYKIVSVDKDGRLCINDVKYSDFAILAPTSTWFDTFRKKFGEFGIPLNVDKDLEIKTDTVIQSISSLFSLLNAINNNDETNIKFYFVSVLRSFLYSYKDNKIYSLLKDYKSSDEYKYFEKLAKKVYSLTLIKGIDLIYKEVDLIDKVTLLGNGLNYLTKLNFLYDKLVTMSSLNFTLEDVVTYFEYINDYKLKLEVKIKADSNDAVKLQTIHKSKGLEYRIIYFVGFNGKSQSDTNKFYISNKNGYYLNEKALNGASFFKHYFKDEDVENSVNEKVRLLYVALTRPVDLGYIVHPDMKEIKVKEFYDCTKYIEFFNFYEPDTKYIDIKNINYDEEEDESDKEIEEKVEQLKIKELNVNYEAINKVRASKISSTTIDEEKLSFGTHMHLLFECLDLKNPDLSITKDEKEKKYLSNFLNLNIIKKVLSEGAVYKEYEFFDKENNINGIIDLMIVYPTYVDIIDYKLKNIDDEAYLKQLNIYKNYIEKTFKLKVHTYLYSITQNHILKVE